MLDSIEHVGKSRRCVGGGDLSHGSDYEPCRGPLWASQSRLQVTVHLRDTSELLEAEVVVANIRENRRNPLPADAGVARLAARQLGVISQTQL